MSRLGDLSRALEILSEQRWVDIGALHTAVAIFTWVSLLWRPVMSLAFRVHKFISKHTGTDSLVRMPGDVAKELFSMSKFVGFASLSLSAKSRPLLFTQDAAGGSSTAQTGLRFRLQLVFPTRRPWKACVGELLPMGRSKNVLLETWRLGQLSRIRCRGQKFR